MALPDLVVFVLVFLLGLLLVRRVRAGLVPWLTNLAAASVAVAVFQDILMVGPLGDQLAVPEVRACSQVYCISQDEMLGAAYAGAIAEDASVRVVASANAIPVAPDCRQVGIIQVRADSTASAAVRAAVALLDRGVSVICCGSSPIPGPVSSVCERDLGFGFGAGIVCMLMSGWEEARIGTSAITIPLGLETPGKVYLAGTATVTGGSKYGWTPLIRCNADLWEDVNGDGLWNEDERTVGKAGLVVIRRWANGVALCASGSSYPFFDAAGVRKNEALLSRILREMNVPASGPRDDQCWRINPDAPEPGPLELGRSCHVPLLLEHRDGCGLTIDPLLVRLPPEIVYASCDGYLADVSECGRGVVLRVPNDELDLSGIRGTLTLTRKWDLKCSRIIGFRDSYVRRGYACWYSNGVEHEQKFSISIPCTYWVSVEDLSVLKP